VKDAEKQVVAVQQQYLDGAITNGERYNKVIEIWSGHRKSFRRDVRRTCRADKEGVFSTRFTSWPTPALADRNSRSASSPVCAD
jgi:tRNA (Thr-GGU) A37 N-methylase